MKKLFLLLTLFGVLAVSCENLDGIINNSQTPNGNTDVNHIFITDSEGEYVVNAEGGEIILVITTNIEYDIVIPGDAQSWLSVADTRAELRMEKLTFTVAENKTNDERSSVVTLYDKDGNILQKINIIQSAKSNTIANNEIWYTTTNGEKLFPYTTEASVFGAIIVSNTYEDGKGVLVFDGDVTSIGLRAFINCTNLATITIPDSVTTIGICAFTRCYNLTAFNGKFASKDGRCLIVGDTLISFAPAGLTEYAIPDSVTSIGNYALCDCNSLTSVTIPDSVTTIGHFAFSGCSSLTSVTIGDGVTTIGEDAFSGCYSLTSVTIPDSVTTIGINAFYCCSSLTSVYCKAVTPPTGGSGMFVSNASGRKIYVPMESVEAYKSASGWKNYADAIVGYNF